MGRQRRSFTAEFKTKVALEALIGLRPITDIAQQYRVHPNQVSVWKRQAVEHMEEGFRDGRVRAQGDEEALKDRLYQQIGRLQMELAWLKKLPGSLIDELRRLVEPDHPTISVVRQCELIGLGRSTYYHQPSGPSETDLLLMGLIDEQFTRTPFYGVPRMTAWLRRRGQVVNHKKVARLMPVMGLRAWETERVARARPRRVSLPPAWLRGDSCDRGVDGPRQDVPTVDLVPERVESTRLFACRVPSEEQQSPFNEVQDGRQ